MFAQGAGVVAGRRASWPASSTIRGHRRRLVLIVVTAADLAEQLKELDATLHNIETVLDLDRMRRDKADLEAQASEPNLWDDPVAAQKITSRLSHVQGEINRVERLRARLDDAAVLLELAEAEADAATHAEAASEISALHTAIDELEVRTLLSGE